ncbi:MAG: hypothetical protein WAV20_08410 [Blastocatellia bacterium]
MTLKVLVNHARPVSFSPNPDHPEQGKNISWQTASKNVVQAFDASRAALGVRGGLFSEAEFAVSVPPKEHMLDDELLNDHIMLRTQRVIAAMIAIPQVIDAMSQNAADVHCDLTSRSRAALPRTAGECHPRSQSLRVISPSCLPNDSGAARNTG